jgi:GNAT superfamily N-acetyltransferase
VLAPATVDAVDAYWAAFLGVDRADLRPAVPVVVPHAAELAGYRGMYAQSFGAAPLVSLPAELLTRFWAAAMEAARGGLVDDGRWAGVFGGRMDVVVGPAAIAYADAGTFRPSPPTAEVRALEDGNAGAVDALRRAVTEVEWAHGGGETAGKRAFGAFADGALAALAGYEVWDGRIAQLSVVTHPAHRGRGLGAATFAHAARAALDAGLVAQHRALTSNTHSLGIARRLGFVPYAASLAVRLRPGSSE